MSTKGSNPAPLAMGELATHFELWLYDKSIHTIRAYGRTLTQFNEYCQQLNRHLLDADITLVGSFLKSLSERGYKRNSLALKVNALKSWFGHLVKHGVLNANPMQHIKTPKAELTVSERILEPYEVYALLNAAAERDRAIILMLYLTGMRVSELVNLTWSNIREVEGGKVYLNLLGKGNKKRTVCISSKNWNEIKSLLGVEYPSAGGGPIFPSRKKGRALQRGQIHCIVKKSALKAGLSEKVSPHWLRHSIATHALRGGCDINQLASVLGHSSVAITSVYLHASEGISLDAFI